MCMERIERMKCMQLSKFLPVTFGLLRPRLMLICMAVSRQACKLQPRPACAQRVAQCRSAAPCHAGRIGLPHTIHQHQPGGFALGALAQAQKLG